jgi:demethylmenaquinone methyltransferase/2-methoxy-6-polyprenyl-1,4-benzoquinol methylase
MAGLEGRERAAYVRRMFGRIAGRYDLLNRLMTFGQDRRWRRIVVRMADLPPGGALLDVATGTGDIALEALHQRPDVRAVGVDFTRAMMHIGQARANGEGVGWVEGDALALPFPDGAFDAAASGYLMRNVVDVPGAFREQMRIVRPGGRVVCLDTTPPRGLLRPFVLLHLRVIIPLLGRVVAGDPAAYTYLPESRQGFKTAEELADIMRKAGLVDVRYRRLAMGAMAIHSGVRPQEDT